MMNEKEYETLRNTYLKERELRNRYEDLLLARTQLKQANSGYEINSIMCHLPSDMVGNIKKFIELLVQHEIDVCEKD